MIPIPGSPVTIALAPVAALVSLGFLCGKTLRLPIKVLANFVIFVSSPCLVLASLIHHPLPLAQIAPIALGAALVVSIPAVGISLIGALWKNRRARNFAVASSFMNSGFIGFPLTLALFGEIGMPLAIIYDLVNAFILFSLGIYLIADDRGILEVLKQPFLYACLIGLTAGAHGVHLPDPLMGALHTIGMTTIPLMLFILGVELSKCGIPSFKIALAGAVVRLAGGLLLGIALSRLFGFTGMERSIFILLSVMPSAVGNVVIAKRYEAEEELVTSVVTMGTFLAPLMIFFVVGFVIK